MKKNKTFKASKKDLKSLKKNLDLQIKQAEIDFITNLFILKLMKSNLK